MNNKKHCLKIAFLCFLVCLILSFFLSCKPKSKGTFEPYVPEEEDPQTMMCVDMDSGRASYGD